MRGRSCSLGNEMENRKGKGIAALMALDVLAVCDTHALEALRVKTHGGLNHMCSQWAIRISFCVQVTSTVAKYNLEHIIYHKEQSKQAKREKKKLFARHSGIPFLTTSTRCPLLFSSSTHYCATPSHHRYESIRHTQRYELGKDFARPLPQFAFDIIVALPPGNP